VLHPNKPIFTARTSPEKNLKESFPLSQGFHGIAAVRIFLNPSHTAKNFQQILTTAANRYYPKEGLVDAGFSVILVKTSDKFRETPYEAVLPVRTLRREEHD
jgi:hypothetical protein